MNAKSSLELLKSRGVKVTPQRRGIIEALAAAGSPLTIQELLAIIRNKFPEISHDTVYRTMDLLIQLQIVAPLHLTDGHTSRYELQDPGNPHHHLVCLGCGTSYCLDACPVADLNVPEADELGFTIKRHALEIYGYCQECRGRRKGEQC